MPTLQSALDASSTIDSYLRQQVTPVPPPSTAKPRLIIQIGYSRLYELDGALLFLAGMQIDADGAPKAYNPVSKLGLDALSNAGHPGNWWGVATINGEPIIQGSDQPAPGFYVSTTALSNPAFPAADQRRYIDASTVPFIVLPNKLGMGLKLGDYCFCFNTKTGDNDFGIYADIGPVGQIGEASIAMAEALKVPSSPRTGGTSGGILYAVFPGSGKGYQAQDKWFSGASTTLEQWGGLARIKALLEAGEIS